MSRNIWNTEDDGEQPSEPTVPIEDVPLPEDDDIEVAIEVTPGSLKPEEIAFLDDQIAAYEAETELTETAAMALRLLRKARARHEAGPTG